MKGSLLRSQPAVLMLIQDAMPRTGTVKASNYNVSSVRFLSANHPTIEASNVDKCALLQPLKFHAVIEQKLRMLCECYYQGE